MNYSNLEILLEIKSLCDWKISDPKENLRVKLSEIAPKVATLINRERDRRSNATVERLPPVGEMEDFRGNSFLPLEAK